MKDKVTHTACDALILQFKVQQAKKDLEKAKQEREIAEAELRKLQQPSKPKDYTPDPGWFDVQPERVRKNYGTPSR